MIVLNNEVDEDKIRKLSGKSLIKIRHVQIALLFFGYILQYGFRNCLSVAIIAMTTEGTSSNPNVPVYNWDNESVILSAFYWAYPIPQFFICTLARFGNKALVLSSVVVNSLSMALMPLAAQYTGSTGVLTLRAVQGFFQGFLVPCCYGLQGRWVPPLERSLTNSIISSGVCCGTIFSRLLTGYLSSSSLGWPASFYILSALGGVWCIVWVFFGADSPAVHPKVSTEERNYIEASLGQEEDCLFQTRLKVPWKAIAMSVPFWAIMVAAIGESWLSTYSATEMPSFLVYAAGLSIETGSLVTSASIIVELLSLLTLGPLATALLHKKWLSVTNCRRLFGGLATYSISIMFICVTFFHDSTVIAAVFISSHILLGGAACGNLVNKVDLSPRFVGTLAGISNGTGQLVAMVAPLLVQFLVEDLSDTMQWRKVFVITGSIGVAAATFFVAFCSGERQWWDHLAKTETEVEVETPKISKSKAEE